MGYEATRNNSGNDVVALGYQAGKDNTVANQFIVKQANINAIPLIQGDFSTGNVGIGTTSPDNLLEIHSASGTGGVNLLKLSATSSAAGTVMPKITFSVNNGTTDIDAGSIMFGRTATGRNAEMRFYVEDATTGTALERLTIDKDGDVLVAQDIVADGIISAKTGATGGFRSSTYSTGQNLIWAFRNAPTYGFSYKQGGTDDIRFHLGDYNNPEFLINKDGDVGIGTTSPSYPLEVVGSTSGISGYFEANVSAEGFIDRTKGWNGTSNEALKELIKIKSSNGEINHTTMPEFAKASYKEPIRNYINETYEEEICETIMINKTREECNNITVYEDYFYEEKQCEYKKGENTYYNYVCNNIMKIGTRPKEGCYNETRTEWETIKVENKTFYEPKQVIYEVCEEVIIEECENINYQKPLLECHNETRTRIVEEVTLVEQEGRDLGAMITLLTESVKALQEENDLIRKELCEKDNTYSWCKQDLGVVKNGR